jgi:hypothetical protein
LEGCRRGGRRVPSAAPARSRRTPPPLRLRASVDPCANQMHIAQARRAVVVPDQELLGELAVVVQTQHRTDGGVVPSVEAQWVQVAHIAHGR